MEKIELQEGQKPVQGLPSGFGRGTTIYATDDSGRITQAITSGAPLDTSNVVPVSVYENPARVGDYYYDTTGRLQVWKNSPTDFIQRYKIAVGGTAAPANTVSLANEGVGAVSGASIGSLVGLLGGPIGAGVGAAVGALAGGLTAHNEAASNALKAWQNEDVKYDSAVEFYKDENGDIKYKLDYSKMGVGGVRSGEGVKEAQNRKTSVSLGADGRLKVTTNPIFATTSRYQELINWISENYAGLNKDTENLDEVLTEIQNGIDGEAQDFITNTRLYADYANRYSADPNIIVASYMTEIAGYVKPDQMKDYDVAVIGDNGNIETKSSQELFDSVYNMSADDKNRLLERLTNIAYGTDETYSENEKSIAYGELQALFAVSANTEKYDDDKYQGMLDADPLITFLSHFSPLGLNAADVVNFVSGGNAIQTKQEYLNQNDFAVFAGAAGGTLAGMGLFKAGTSLIQKGMKLLPGTKQLFQASLEGQTGGALAGYAKLQGDPSALFKASAASAAFKTLKVGVFDAALAGATSLTSKKDFWTEFGQDFARDATLEMTFSYLDMVKFQHAVTDSMVQAVVNPETGNIEVLPTAEKVYTDDGIEMPQVATGGAVTTPAGERIGYADVNGTKVFYRNGQIMTVNPTGDVVNDAPINGVPALKSGVNVQSDPNVDIATALTKAGYPAGTNVIELSSKSLDSAVAAGKFAKWDTSKVGLAINKALFNKNAALDAVNNMALAKTGDRNAWQNAQEYFVSVWDNAEREITSISNGTYYPEAVKAFNDYTFQFGQLNLAQKYTKKDANYLKALIQIERAQYLNDTRIPGDERDYVAEAMEKYSEALAIPEDRAQTLQQFSEIRKARHNATKEAALRSGWVDAKRLANVMESDMQKEIGWVPVWGKKQTYNGLLNTFYGITPERNPQKRWLNKGEWVDLDVLEDPLTADERFLSFVGTNMGINAMKDITVDVLGKAGLLLDETAVQEHSNQLSSVKNVDELEKKFNDLVAKKRKEIEKKVPSEKQYADMMEKLVKNSGALEALDEAITSLEPTPTVAKVDNLIVGTTAGEISDSARKIINSVVSKKTRHISGDDTIEIIRAELGRDVAERVFNKLDEGGYLKAHQNGDLADSEYYAIVRDTYQKSLLEMLNDKEKSLLGGIDKISADLADEASYIDGRTYAKNVTPDSRKNIEGYKQFKEDHLEKVDARVVPENVEDFVLHIIRPGGDVDVYNSYLRDGTYKDKSDWAHSYMDDFKDRYTDDIEELAFQYFSSDAEKIAKEFEADFTKSGYWETMIKYQGALEDMLAEKLLQGLEGNYRLKDPTILYRGVNSSGTKLNPAGDFSWLKEGGEFKDNGFGFVSLSDNAARHYAAGGDGDNIILEYHIPEGQRLFYFGDIGRGGNDGGAFVLPSDITGTVGKITTDADGVKHVEIYIGDAPILQDEGMADMSDSTKFASDNDYPGFKINERADGNSGKLGMLDESEPNFTLEGTRRDYYRDYKGRELRVIEMAPEEYEKLMDRDGRALSSAERERASYYTKKFNDGERVDIPYIDYGSDWKITGQEGRHRAVGAAEAGIEKIPVIIDYPRGAELPDFLKQYTDVTDSFVIRPQDENPISNLADTVRDLLNKAAEYNNQFGYEFDVESYMNTSAIPNLTEAVNKRDRNLGAAIINQAVLEVAPYQSREALLSSQQEEVAREWRKWAEKNVQTDGDKKQAVDLVAAKINGETTDAYEMGAATTASGMGGRYPITWFKNGKPYTRFIKYDTPEQQRLAEEITHLFEDKQLIKNPGIVDRAARTFANNFRLLTTALDVTRAPLNFARDTVRGEQTSGGESFINPGELFKSVLELGDYTPEQKQKLSEALDDVARRVAGETYNKAYGDRRKAQVAITKEYLSKSGANPLKRFIYNAKHDKMSLLEKPADFFEGLTRRRLAKSAATVALRKAQMEGKNFDEQMEILYSSATFAGREYTANFARKGTLIGATSRYVAYQSSAYAGLDGLKRAFINNPQGVARNFATFLVCYVILLADTLGDEESRKNYYRLSDYDRGNSLVISLGDNTVLTIPLDQEIASLLFPYRRFIETLNGVDPVSFFELMWGTFTEPMPFDLSGFTEGEGFNLSRGLEKLTAQNMPTGLTPIQEAATGYDLYYGSDLRVTDETLRDYGIYDPQAGDYTTTGNNSQLLRNIANATGIPQWQLQVMVSGYGGNVGQYVLNIIDKLSGASEDAQGGKDFANAIFKSFVATDQDNANSVFYDGIQKLKQEKNKVIQTIANYNDQLATATGETKVEIQNRIRKAKDDYATKVGDFVDQYISAYEITGGLPKSQAMQVYYLFRFDDDDTVYQAGSVEEYYNNQAVQQFKNEATRLSAPILDRYYNNRIGNIYQDSDGTWRHYLSSGAQAMKNTVYGAAEQQKVDLLNILEGKNSLKSLRNQIKNARSQAFDAKNYDIADKLGYELDRRVIARIKPYIDQYGAENVLGNTEVLDYLSDWFIVPDEFIRTKKGKYVSLAHNASSQEAFVRPFIKYIFGLPTNYYSYSDTNLTGPSL